MPLTARQRSIHNKNGAKRAASFNKGKKGRKASEGEFLVTNAPTDLHSIGYPGGAFALVLLLTARLIAAYYGHISDCDETYNYLEPLHYLIYGNGLQTWEYSPAYAIRSYAPLWLFAIPAKLLSYVFSPVTIFYLIRALLAVMTACAELMFYKAVCHEFGVQVGRVWVWGAAGAAGAGAAGAAVLPAAWASAAAQAALACWWRGRYPAAILITAANVLLNWPFTALIGLPIAIDMLIIKRRISEFMKWSLLSLVLILVPIVVIDSWHYGRLVVAPWNIVAYNIFTDHGPDLYGVEPWTYYFINGFLNFNIIWVLALACPVLLAVCTLVSPRLTARASFCSPYWLSLMPLALWLAVFMTQPHKEERFLYPVYSMIMLAGAIGVDCLQKLSFSAGALRGRSPRAHYLPHTAPLMVLLLLLATLAGVSRMVSVYNNYAGPMSVLRAVPPAPPAAGPLHVCFGKEWYRAPSSFHLRAPYRMRFVASEFDGQLPAPYADTGNATRLIHPYFNDMNKGDNRTLLKPSQCHYLVDSDIGTPTKLQPAYHKDTDTWEKIASVPILDAERSHRIFRAFYIPFLSSKHNVFANLYLLKNKAIIT